MTETGFVHLRLRSEYSMSDGSFRLAGGGDKLSGIACAADMGMPALALTDSGNLFGAIKFYANCQKRGIKPIIGCDVAVATDEELPSRLLLLCGTVEGYRNLCDLLTRSYSGEGERGIIPQEWLEGSADGLIALSGAKDGEIGRLLLSGDTDGARAAAKRWSERFPGRFHLEVQRAGFHLGETLVKRTATLGMELDLPLVATHPVQFLAREDFEAHEIRACIAAGEQAADERRLRRFTPEQYLKSPEEMAELFSDMPQALANAVAIARRCSLTISMDDIRLPKIPLPDGQDAGTRLRELARNGLASRLALRSAAEPAAYEKRLDTELEVIGSMGYSGYFLIVEDFVSWARKQSIPVGPGRGSGSGSLVSYALGITDLDPLEHGLIFERFLNPERVSLPDLDIDFCQIGRDRVIDYVRKRYGDDSVSQILTLGTLGAKAAVRDTGRALGMPYSRVDEIARLIPNTLNITLAEALKDSEDLSATVRDDEDVAKLIEVARAIEGLPRNVSTHAGGVLIAPGKLSDYCPLYVAEDSASPASQYDKDDVEKIGLVKFDLLGLRTLTIIDSAIAHVKRLADPDFSLNAVPFDDPEVYRMYAEADTVGVFQCESRGMRDLMRKLQPDRFGDLVALLALFRPGPIESGMHSDYIERKHERAAVVYPHDSLEPILRDTYGVVVYQEQVMEIARELAGYSMGEADLLRRAMGKKDPKEMSAQRERFSTAAADRIGARAAKKLFDDIEKFAGYGFNKSHAAAYAVVSYWTAYLKRHHPAAFYAAALSHDMNNTDGVHQLIRDAARHKVKVLPPAINEGGNHFRPLPTGEVYYGLGAVKGVGRAAAEHIEAARLRDGDYRSLEDFCLRVAGTEPPISRRGIETLIHAGAFDEILANRRALVESLPVALRHAEETRRHSTQGWLFGEIAEPTPPADVEPWGERAQLLHELDALGFTLSGHLFELAREELGEVSDAVGTITPLRAVEADAEVFVAGILAKRVSSRGLRRIGMEVLVLDDGKSTIEVRAGRVAIRDLGTLETGKDLILARGRAQESGRGDLTVRASKVYTLHSWKAANADLLKLHCVGGMESLGKLKEVISDHPGTCPVRILADVNECRLTIYPEDKVKIGEPLLMRLCEIVGESRVNLEYRR